MRLVDTSIWVEWISGSAFGAYVASDLPKMSDWLVPTIIQFELSKWISRTLGDGPINEILAFSQTCVVVDLDTQTALFAADLSASHKLATADAIIYATAVRYEADLLTCDRHFDGLNHVIYRTKSTITR